MTTPSLRARCRLALALICSLVAAAPPALAEARVIFKSERSLVLRVRDLNGDRVRDVAYFIPDQRTQFDGPGRAEVQTENGVILARFRASGQHEVFALGANHPADIDDNQILDADDMALLVQRAGHEGAPGLPGDVNFDGVVNEADGALLMAALNAVDGLGWVRFDRRWPAAFEPDAAERDNCWVWGMPDDYGYWACRPSDGDDPDGGGAGPGGTGPLGPGPGSGGPGGPGPGGNDCIGVEVVLTTSSPTSFVTIRDDGPTPLTFSAGGNPPGGTATWSVLGAEVVQSNNTRCDTEVYEPGLVVVMTTYRAPNNCTAEAALELPAYSIDLSIDIDENGTIDEADIEAESVAPGAILLANNFDEDGDGVEGFADGFDWNPLIEQDDDDNATLFVPLKVRVGGVESGNARLSLIYPASDPLAIGIGDDGWEFPEGQIRIWKKNGDESRSAAMVIDGGDYVAPGEYTLADLGLLGGAEVTLYVETIRESLTEGDILIAAAVSADEESGWVGSDVVVGTASAIEVAARNFDEALDHLNQFLVATTPYSTASPPLSDSTSGPWQAYTVMVHTPLLISHLTVGNLPLLLERVDSIHQTHTFLLMLSDNSGPPDPGSFLPVLVLDTPGNIDISLFGDDAERARFFGSRKVRFFKAFDVPDVQRTVGQHTRSILDEMKANGWTPADTNYLPNTAFGNVLHRDLVGRLSASSDRWIGNVYVDIETLQVRAITTGPGPAGTGEVDLMQLADGYDIVIGEPIDSARVVFRAEMKTAANGAISDEKRELMDRIFGTNDWHLIVPPERYYLSHPDGVGFHEHENGAIWKATKLLGLTAAASLMFQTYEQVANAEPLIEAYRDATLPNLGYYDREAAVLTFFEEFRTWMGYFDPTGDLADVTFLFNLYAYLKETE